MKKYFKFLISLIIMINLTTVVGKSTMYVPNDNKVPIREEDRLQKIKEKGVLTVLSSNNMPFSYKDPKTGVFSGSDADIIKEVAKRLGVKEVRAKYIPFVNIFQEFINNDDVDLMVDVISITDERENVVNFTIPIYKESEWILVRKDSGINSKEDLKNKVLGVIGGSIYENMTKNWKMEGEIRDYMYFSDTTSLTLAVKNNVIDAFLVDSIIGQNIILTNPGLNVRLLSPNQYKPEKIYDIGYPVKKKDTVLLNAVNEKIQEMKNDGTLYQILVKHGMGERYIP